MNSHPPPHPNPLPSPEPGLRWVPCSHCDGKGAVFFSMPGPQGAREGYRECGACDGEGGQFEEKQHEKIHPTTTNS